MYFSNGCRLTVFWAFIAGVVFPVASTVAEEGPFVTPKLGAAEHRILEALDDDTRLEFIETPLEDVFAFLRDQHDINIVLDTKALDDVGIGTDIPITQNLKSISLRSALRLMLDDLELTYEVCNEVLLITTAKGAVARAQVKIYDVSNLLGEGETAETVANPLLLALQPSCVSTPKGGMDHGYGMGGMPGTEGGYGGYPGGGISGGAGKPKGDFQSITQSARRVVPFKHLLMVRDTTTGHEEIARVLKGLADALK